VLAYSQQKQFIPLTQQNIEDTVSLQTSSQVGECRNGNWGKGGWQVIFEVSH
jgi:hypothetical protein